MQDTKKIRSTFTISADAYNPIVVEATIVAEKHLTSWNWAVEELHLVEIHIGQKDGIDITNQVKSSPRRKALIMSQVADLEDQILDELEKNRDVDNSLFNQMADIVRTHNKIFYGI